MHIKFEHWSLPVNSYPKGSREGHTSHSWILKVLMKWYEDFQQKGKVLKILSLLYFCSTFTDIYRITSLCFPFPLWIEEKHLQLKQENF